MDLHQRLLAQAVRFAESGAAPVPPRLAATVLLLRPAHPGFEVFVVRRAAGMAFAAGMYAFPGGAVEPADAEGDPAGADGDPAGGGGVPGPVVRAAVRELYEETGVRVRAADLVPWTRWITPEFEPRRYDTYFLVAALPEGQDPVGVSGEADRAEWIRPADAVTRTGTGELLMLPPTAVTLSELARLDSVAAVLAGAAGRDAATAIEPRLERDPEGTPRLVGWPPGYP